MEKKSFIPKKKYVYTFCEVCGERKLCTWHHIGHRRYDDNWIWVCVFNGEEGCHERIHRDVEWAYANGYLVKHNTSYKITMKEPKKKPACTHSKSYYDSRLGYIKCNYCGKQVQALSYGIKKAKKETPKKMYRPEISSRPTVKMGQEVQDPRIKKTADIRSRLSVINVNLKKGKLDEARKRQLIEEQTKLMQALYQIKLSYED